MKLNKIILAMACLGGFALSTPTYANDEIINSEKIDILKELNKEVKRDSNNTEEVRNKVIENFPILAKYDVNFKVDYIPEASLYELSVGTQKVYTNKDVSYININGQTFVNKNGQMFNITSDPKKQVQEPQGIKEDNINGSKEETFNGLKPKSVENQKIQKGFDNDIYLNSLKNSKNFNDLKLSALLQYIGNENPKPLPDDTADYIKDLELKNAAKIVYGNGERIAVIFADPDCPYCQSFENRLTENADKLNLTLYVMPWALDIHKDAGNKVDFIWSQEDPGEAWKSWMTFAKRNPELIKNGTAWEEWIKETKRVKGEVNTAPINNTLDFVKKFNLKYTPTIIYPNGTSSQGDIEAEKFLTFLDYSEVK